MFLLDYVSRKTRPFAIRVDEHFRNTSTVSRLVPQRSRRLLEVPDAVVPCVGPLQDVSLYRAAPPLRSTRIVSDKLPVIPCLTRLSLGMTSVR